MTRGPNPPGITISADSFRCFLDPEISVQSRRVWGAEAGDMVGLAASRYMGSFQRAQSHTQLLYTEKRLRRVGSMGAG
jgi:hypothetical protein